MYVHGFSVVTHKNRRYGSSLLSFFFVFCSFPRMISTRYGSLSDRSVVCFQLDAQVRKKCRKEAPWKTQNSLRAPHYPRFWFIPRCVPLSQSPSAIVPFAHTPLRRVTRIRTGNGFSKPDRLSTIHTCTPASGTRARSRRPRL